jgi:polysaccharide pyruvyl transferase WcaK-like protein
MESHIKKTYHNCPPLMEKKRQLEQMVRSYNGSFELTKHFKTEYKKRKQFFYRKIINEILKEENEKEKEICELIKDILFIYSKKREELEYVLDLVNSMEAEISHREEMRESMMEDFRGCD